MKPRNEAKLRMEVGGIRMRMEGELQGMESSRVGENLSGKERTKSGIYYRPPRNFYQAN